MIDDFKHWMVGLDLTNMDEVINGYVSFLANKNTPDQITFFHIIDQPGLTEELQELFPEFEEAVTLNFMIREKLEKKVSAHLDIEKTEVEILIREGNPTQSILSLLEEYNPDLLILGKKSGYEGEGVLPRKIVKYAHCSTLFVSENTYYNLDNVLVPFSFTSSSAKALRAAQKLVKSLAGQLHIQHVYEYPKQFFPYIPSGKYEQRMNKHLQKKFKKFKEKYDLKELAAPRFSVNEDGRVADKIYDYTLHTKSDLIIIGAKSKSSAAALFIDDLAEELAEYHFGRPVLIFKDKKEHVGLLKSILDKD